jgi:hypothetical protein
LERLKFVISDDIIAEMLGRQNFTTSQSAILEIVKNSYDAGAHKCEIRFTQDSISIMDDGCGMSQEDITSKWMSVGNSAKKYREHDRILSGSKGVGRFALARLGDEITLSTRTNSKEPINVWHTDWKENTLSEHTNAKCEIETSGSYIEICKLRDGWDILKQKALIGYLNRMYHGSEMLIRIILTDNQVLTNSNIFESDDLKLNSREHVTMHYQSTSNELEIDVDNYEFQNAINTVVTDMDTRHFSKKIHPSIDNTANPGSFSAELYFDLHATRADSERFFYKEKVSDSKKYNDLGIILFRNAFSVTGFEGFSDWLKLEQRARKSPAAASHKTGRWRVRANQLWGYVEIDRNENPKLKDLANRQGLEENSELENFRKLVFLGLNEFETYRQSIIRQVRKFRDAEVEELSRETRKKSQLLRRVVENPNKLNALSESDQRLTVAGIRELQQQTKQQKETIKNIKEDYQYEVRVLSSLATQGLHASRQAHNLNSERATAEGTVEQIIQRLRQLQLWEILEENPGKFRKTNVPRMLDELNASNKKIAEFVSILLDGVSRKKFPQLSNQVQHFLNNSC